MLSVHCLLVCPIKPHLLQSLWILSYLHWTHTLNPSSNLNINPASTRDQGSTLTFIRTKRILCGNLSSKSTLSKCPWVAPYARRVLGTDIQGEDPQRDKVKLQFSRHQVRSPLFYNKQCSIHRLRTFGTDMVKIIHVFKMQDIEVRISANDGY